MQFAANPDKLKGITALIKRKLLRPLSHRESFTRIMDVILMTTKSGYRSSYLSNITLLRMFRPIIAKMTKEDPTAYEINER